MTHSPDPAMITRCRSELADRAASFDQRLRAAGGAGVTVLAVTKGHPVEVAIAASLDGFVNLGENYAQELAAKQPTVAEHNDNKPVRWHFVGRLQSNKVRLIADVVSVWQSVDRLKVARVIAKRKPGATVLAQVNLSGEPQKAGCSFDELDDLIGDMGDLDLDVAGLMGVGTAGDDQSTAAGFARLRKAVDRHGLRECSMGMSADLELAVAEGSTMVRVGTDLFGPRP